MDWMPRDCSTGTHWLMAVASSMNSTSAMPAGETMVGVVSVTTPIRAICLPPPTSKTSNGGSIGIPESFMTTLAAR
jgi:hypothetical protein